MKTENVQQVCFRDKPTNTDWLTSIQQQWEEAESKKKEAASDTRPYFFVYGDTPNKSIEHHGDFRTFDDAKVKADALLASGHILVHIRRAEWPRESWLETDIVVWAAASPEVDWR